jgi:ArsR family transcriptional regulator
VLREAGLIDCERRGTWVYYWPVPAALQRLSVLLATPGLAPNSAADLAMVGS